MERCSLNGFVYVCVDAGEKLMTDIVKGAGAQGERVCILKDMFIVGGNVIQKVLVISH